MMTAIFVLIKNLTSSEIWVRVNKVFKQMQQATK